MNFIGGIIFTGIAFVLAVRSFLLMAILDIELPTPADAGVVEN